MTTNVVILDFLTIWQLTFSKMPLKDLNLN